MINVFKQKKNDRCIILFELLNFTSNKTIWDEIDMEAIQ